jgi:hypothetical protein
VKEVVMPSTNPTVRAHRSTRALRAVPNPIPAGRTVAEDKLWAALHAHPASTTSDLAAHAGIGYSTAGKILATWATDGSITRTSGPTQAGRRAADTWTITDTTPDDGTESVVDQLPDTAVTDEPVHDTALTAADDTGSELTGSPNHDEADQHPGLDTPPDNATPSENGVAPVKAVRLGKGALRGMVEDYLTERPGEQFSPSAIGKALNRSSGAITNALEKLVADGYAIQTQNKPKRYRIKTHWTPPGRDSNAGPTGGRPR